jgi:transketolase
MINISHVLFTFLSVQIENNPDVYVVYGDGYKIRFNDSLIQKYPDRFVKCGIAEQNSVSIAAGLALTGKIVYLLIDAGYLSRCIDQIKLDCAYNNANVRIIGYKSGFASGKAGYSHWNLEDISLMRCFQNMAIIAPGTPQECDFLLHHSVKHIGPMYIRLDNVYSNFNLIIDSEIQFGKMSKIMFGKHFAMFAVNNMLKYAYNICKYYLDNNIFPSLFSYHTLMPFDTQEILSIIKLRIPIITLEEHYIGGLGSIIAQILATNKQAINFLPLYINDCVFHYIGDQDYLVEKTMRLNSVTERIDAMLL